ncbi:hypothetical protein JQ587_12835 [Bradyrhizobium manausense]|nr:hypothetical protein [Bradyrhizobium manausense]
MTLSVQCAEHLPFVLERLTEENLRASRIKHPTALDGQFYAAFGVDHASIGDAAGFQRLQGLAGELLHAPAVTSRLLQLKSKGLSVEFVVYDEPAGHFLCILVKNHAIYDEAVKHFDPIVTQKQRAQP